MSLLLTSLAVVIIIPLAWYAGGLLYKLRQQQHNIKKVRTQRLNKITESIRVIAMAMEQQQCNFSEGCIRLYHLLECLPPADKADFSIIYSGIYTLYEEVKDLATHLERKQLSREELNRQDAHRVDKETLFAAKILIEVGILRNFTI
ncbi:DUF2489 domain-containing protein [Paraglaciecola sp.]|uniref:DUF2489 domain-containing protein n=1 Tax=Paraglaciecola sp. TaxID=1920173 RepID=UPI0030F47153